MKTSERDLLARAKRERAGLRVVWEQARQELPARRQALLAAELTKIKPVLIQKNGTRYPCEPSFRLTSRESQSLAAGMLSEGASRNEILATVEISPSTLAKVKRANPPKRPRKWLSHAVENVLSEIPAWVPPEGRGPGVIALDANRPGPGGRDAFPSPVCKREGTSDDRGRVRANPSRMAPMGVRLRQEPDPPEEAGQDKGLSEEGKATRPRRELSDKGFVSPPRPFSLSPHYF